MKNREVLVNVEGLSKKFCKDLRTSLWYGVKDLFGSIRKTKGNRELRPKEFWAVKDVSFELRRGECLGLIGHNGAGKSTLLKILNGLINPDDGKVTIRGQVGALIELGAGFNPVLTGRENIYNNGAVLGFTKPEIDSKLEQIIAFSELEEFMDMPLQHYSSGMKVRLGFAVAAQMEPDVLLIDEVLAVGDLGFVLKCFKTIDKILPNTAIIFVSHNMPMVSRICNQVMLLEKGKSSYYGKDVAKAIDIYYRQFSTNENKVVFTDDTIKLNKVKVLTDEHNYDQIPQLNWCDDLKISFKFQLLEEIPIPSITIHLLDKEQRPVASFQRTNANSKIKIEKDIIEFTLIHKNIQLSKGVYSINIALRNEVTKEPIYRENDILSFQIIHEEDSWAPFMLQADFE